jgi:hypothetical protein
VQVYWFRKSPGTVDKVESIGLRGHFKRTSEFTGRDADVMDAGRSRTGEKKAGWEVWISIRPPKKLPIQNRRM